MEINDENSNDGTLGYFVPIKTNSKSRSEDIVDIREMVVKSWLLLFFGTVLGAALLIAVSFAGTPPNRIRVRAWRRTDSTISAISSPSN